MQVYLVGGAVRDKLLGQQPRDRDWVVVGATPEEMLEKGFKPVGKDFPVFLHPETGEEYALARTERKTAPGYHGFEVHAAPDVTLEEDLKRRDLTINAMAEDSEGNLIDLFGGREDLELGRLRHVSPAFAEDPVRILRVARYAARYGKWGFRVAHTTNKLMRQMVEAGEVDALVPERVWQELENALREETPSRFFEVLRGCGALGRIFPELEALFGVPQPKQHHPEEDTGVHVMMVLDQSARLSSDPRVRFAALVHDLGKGTTPETEWPSHHAHEQRGVALVEGLCERLRTPREYRDLALVVTRHHGVYHRAEELRPATFIKTLEAIDAFRRPERVEQFLLACEADSRGRPGFEERDFPQPALFRRAFEAANSVSAKAIVDQGYRGAEIGERLREARIEAVKTFLRI
ncbi:multifunctional CCA addition/repair protein [Thiohalomonas denitrificans]|uniref:Multifunctional CCA protein n=1 Tax=Thiohalomonas denitrificans TaxID=415747 RepID=A0A1G5PSV9_9GAMM|nr:multifunctional CCA addition/repair protein [Thiohalomonas denitrificans]SCZ52502.1 tRNA nucleotidyltransferase (CCA-adding enzyme) [Thiohalomonas denitrificans]